MIGLLSKLVGFLSNIGVYLLNAVIDSINLLIAAIGILLATLLSLLPTMPNPPSLGSSNNWIGWLNYYLPVSGLLAGLVVFVGLWTSLLVIRIALKWAKAL